MRILAVILLVIGLAATGVSPYLDSVYGGTRPQIPRQSTGQVYPLNVHGTVVYLTRREHLLEFWLFAGGLVVAAAGGLLFQRQVAAQRRDA